MSVTITTLPTKEVFEAAGDFVVDLLRGEGESLLLLSGGSAIASYARLAVAVTSSEVANLEAVGLVDERFGAVGHPDSNERQINDRLHLASICRQNGVAFGSVLQPHLSMDETAKAYNDWLVAHWSSPKRIAVLGIGVDGHTAGILPMSLEAFEELFAGDSLAIGYLPAQKDFAGRITLTPQAISQLTDIVVIAAGSAKAAVVRHVFGPLELAAQVMPAVLLRDGARVTVFTDITI